MNNSRQAVPGDGLSVAPPGGKGCSSVMEHMLNKSQVQSPGKGSPMKGDVIIHCGISAWDAFELHLGPPVC